MNLSKSMRVALTLLATVSCWQPRASAQTNGLVLLFDFPSAPIGNVIVDDSGLGLNGTNVNGSAVWLPLVAGRTDVMDFNSALPAEIIVPPSTNYLAANGTIAFWMRSSNLSANKMIFDHRTTNGVVIFQSGGYLGVQPTADSGYVVDDFYTAASPSNGNWHHIAYVYQQDENGTNAMYVDGLLDTATVNTAGWGWDLSEELEIGASHDPYWRSFDGQLADFRIYSRNLAPEEVAELARTPPILANLQILANGVFQFQFTNPPGTNFAVYTSTNLSLPFTNWMMIGAPSYVAPGVFQFTSPPFTNDPQHFFRVGPQ